jgi:hypothetical protein
LSNSVIGDEIILESDQKGDLVVISNVDKKLEEEFINKGDEIVEKYANMKPFEDIQFYGDKAISLTGNTSEYGVYSWLRPREMVDSKYNRITNPKVIVNGFGCNDIGQGSLGDCWFLSALS